MDTSQKEIPNKTPPIGSLTLKTRVYVIPKSILGALATPTGYGGIVDLNAIENSPDIQSLVQFAGSMAQ